MPILKKMIPLQFVLLSVAASSILSYFASEEYHRSGYSGTSQESAQNGRTGSDNCTYKIARLGGYNYVAPLMYDEPDCESTELEPVKQAIEKIIVSEKVSGTISSASVYIRDLSKGNWIAIDGDKKYSPGSLMKVPELIAFFKMNEAHPGILDRKILYTKQITGNKKCTFLSKSIEVGKSYTIRELLYYMITYSDNNATYLLNQQVDLPTFAKVFTDLGLPAPDWKAMEYNISAADYSLFMKVLYNTSYLDIKDSEYCTELLSNCDFKLGLAAGIPNNVRIAHKFGEGGTSISPQLSESGIIYYNHSAYLITIMTNGRDMNKLPDVISTISNIAYEQMTHYYSKNS